MSERKAAEKDQLVHKFSKNMRKLLDNRDAVATPTGKENSGERGVKFNTETIETSFFGTQTAGKIKDSSVLEECKVKLVKGKIHTPRSGLASEPDCGSSVELRGPAPAVLHVLDKGDKTTPVTKEHAQNAGGNGNSSKENRTAVTPRGTTPKNLVKTKSDRTTPSSEKVTGQHQSRLVSHPSNNSGGVAKGSGRVAKTDPSPVRTVGNGAVKNGGKTEHSQKARVDKSPMRTKSNSAIKVGGKMEHSEKPRVDRSPVKTVSHGTGKIGGKTDQSEKSKDTSSSKKPTSHVGVKSNVKVHQSETSVELNKSSKDQGKNKTVSTPTVSQNSGTKVAGVVKSIEDPTSTQDKTGPPTITKSAATGAVHLNGSSKAMTHSDVCSVAGSTKVHAKSTPLKPPSGRKPGMGTPAVLNVLETSVGGGAGMFKTPSPFVVKSRRYTMDEVKDEIATPECFAPVAFETPRTGIKLKHRWSSGDVQDMRGEEGDQCNMTVAVRVRPFHHRELPDAKCILSMIDNETVLTTDRDTHRFTYDYSFWSFDQAGGEFASQLEVYNHLAQPMLGKAFDGYNTCLFAYGQTGSGKSYSIMGQENNPEEVGIIPRFSDELFKRTEIKKTVDTQTTYNIEISYFEIYNEKIHDLLCPSIKDKAGKKPNLKVREHNVFGPYVEHLSTYVVNSYEDIKRWLSVGNKHRATAATCMNEKSSRSHSVFTVILTQTKLDIIDGQSHEHAIRSKVNLVDLAGSERQSLAKTSGDRLREGSNINKSLSTLGKVISILAEQSSHRGKKAYIPYRDSVLTWLLKESVGGNSKTAMLATISPSSVHADETLSTLRYANHARQIINKVRVNEDPKARLIRELKAEIERLRLSKEGEDVQAGSYAEVAALKEKLLLKELQMEEMTKTWQERMKRSEQKQKEEARVLEKSGVAFTVDNKLPNLVNLNEDPQLSEVLLYVLKPGQTKVGQTSEASTADIQLSGVLIADNHCTLSNLGDKVTIMPVGDAPTYVNGNLITAETRLHHGDRVIIGGNHYFRLNFPVEVQNRKSGDLQLPAQPRDFEYAQQELTRVQNEKLEVELEDAHKQQEEMAEKLEEAQEVICKVKQDAHEQKQEFQDRLSLLEKKLTEERATKSDSQAETIQKLEREKMMLEQEVKSHRKRLEMEAEARQKATENYQPQKSSILDVLSNYVNRLNNEVERLEAVQGKRNAAPAVTKATPSPGTTLRHRRKDLCKNMLLVRESNKISQHLKKQTSFAIKEQCVPDCEEVQTLIKVTNTKLGVSTYWTLDKFEDNLLKMREMYEGDLENLAGDEDDVFYDPSDTWEKDDRLDVSVGLSPKLWKSVKRQGSPRLSFGSAPGEIKRTLKLSSTASSVVSQSKSCDTSLSQPDEAPSPAVGSQCVLNLVREFVSSSVTHFKNSSFKENCADRLLSQCEVLKCAVVQVLDTYNNTQSETSSVLDSPHTSLCLRQLDVGLSNLQLVASLWLSQYSSLDSGLIRELLDLVVSTVKKLGRNIELFLQGIDYDIDSMVQEASAQAFESLFILCRCCGELALATETAMATLVVTNSVEESQIREGVDLRKYFLCGCDQFVGKTLHGGLRTIEDCEVKVMELADNLGSVGSDLSTTEELVKQVEVTVCSCKVLVEKLQQIQVELDSTINLVTRDSLLAGSSQTPRATDFYQQSYTRSQALIGHISNLADGVSLTTQATAQLTSGSGESSLRRLYRCTDMVQKASSHILACSLNNQSDSSTSLVSSVNSSTAENSVLTDTQLEQLDVAGQEIQFSTATLGVLVKRRLESISSSTGRSKMLPQSPSSGSVGKSPSKLSKRQNLQFVDLADSVR